MSGEDVHFFFTMRDQIKLYHWQTHSFARHKATDDVIKSLDENIDEYVETYMGKYGRMKVGPRTSKVHIKNMTEAGAVTFVRNCIEYLKDTLTRKLKPSDTDLFNLRDEMLGDLNKLLYLFTLK